jgi:hypothetical protein
VPTQIYRLPEPLAQIINQTSVNLFKPFDYIFFRLATVYRRQFGDDDDLYPIGIVSIVQWLNILSIVIVMAGKIDSIILFFSILVGLILLNFYRYKKIRKYSEIRDYYEDESTTQKDRRSMYYVLYFILSFITFVGSNLMFSAI